MNLNAIDVEAYNEIMETTSYEEEDVLKQEERVNAVIEQLCDVF